MKKTKLIGFAVKFVLLFGATIAVSADWKDVPGAKDTFYDASTVRRDAGFGGKDGLTFWLKAVGINGGQPKETEIWCDGRKFMWAGDLMNSKSIAPESWEEAIHKEVCRKAWEFWKK